MSKLAIDFDGLNEKDIELILRLIDMTTTKTNIIVYKLSKPKTEPVNYAEVRNSGLPYSDVVFIDFEDYSMRTEYKFNTMIAICSDAVILTKDYNLAVMLRLQGAGVFLL